MEGCNATMKCVLATILGESLMILQENHGCNSARIKREGEDLKFEQHQAGMVEASTHVGTDGLCCMGFWKWTRGEND